MKLSIVTATYNAASHLKRTIDSVAEQDYENIEYVIVDGSSSDSSVDVIRAAGDRVSSWTSEPDQGIYDALNKGIERSSGDVVAFLHAGDVYASSDAASRMMSALKESDAHVAYSDVVFFRESDSSKVVRHYSSASFNAARIASGFMPAHPTMFVRRGTYERVGAYDISYAIAGDFDWVARAFSVHEVRSCYVEGVLIRMVAGGLSTRGWSSKKIITDEMLRACRAHGIRTGPIRLWLRFPIKTWELLTR
ncbi:MAG: glycosyltransferase family 2 protein [Pseudomonadota bacterium]